MVVKQTNVGGAYYAAKALTRGPFQASSIQRRNEDDPCIESVERRLDNLEQKMMPMITCGKGTRSGQKITTATKGCIMRSSFKIEGTWI